MPPHAPPKTFMYVFPACSPLPYQAQTETRCPIPNVKVLRREIRAVFLVSEFQFKKTLNCHSERSLASRDEVKNLAGKFLITFCTRDTK